MRITRAARYEQLGARTTSPTGSHLAIYLEPLDDPSPDAYATRFANVAAAFLPEVFDMFGDLESMDVCQEPPPAEDDSPEPRPFTQLLATRAQATAIDWPTVTLADLIRANSDHPNRLTLSVRSPVSDTPTWKAAQADAIGVGGPRP